MEKEILARAFSTVGNFATFARPFFSPLLYNVQFTAVTHNRRRNTIQKINVVNTIIFLVSLKQLQYEENKVILSLTVFI